MLYNYLNPISNKVIDDLLLYTDVRFGTSISIHSKENKPEIVKEIDIAIIGVFEDRDTVNNIGTGNDFSVVRKELYQLYFNGYRCCNDWNTF